MNYVLQIQLEGAEKTDAALDSLLKKVGSLSTASISNIEMDKMIDATGLLKSGEKAGEAIGEGMTKGVKSKFKGVLWNSKSMLQAQFPETPSWLKSILPEQKRNKGLQQFINQRHAESGKEVEKDFWTKLYPPIKPQADAKTPNWKSIGMADLPKIFGSLKAPEMPEFLKSKSFYNVEKKKATDFISPPETTPKSYGAELAKIHALPDIGKILEEDAKSKKIDIKKILTGAFLGISNPYIGSRVLSDELGKKLSAGKEGGIAGGLFGKGGIAGFSEIFLAFKAFKFAIDITSASLRQMMKAIESADRIYAKALIGGMGIQMTTKRSILAQIMGVSEQDLFRFGAQMAYLNPRLAEATRIISQTAKPLAQVSWEFKILKTDMDALFADMANDAAPALMNLSKALDNLVKTAIYLYDHAPKDVIKGASEGILTGIGNLTLGAWGTMAAKLGLKLNSALDKPNPMPDASSWMKQLPASHWEKMGLVTMGGSQNYQKDIAKNTKEMAEGMKALAGAMSGKRQNSYFGMSPATAQP